MYTLLACTQLHTAFLYVYEPHFKVNVTRVLMKDSRTEIKSNDSFWDK